MEKATFAAGCFWGVEELYRNTDGVIHTRVGFTGGHITNPSYKDVCSDTTGHAEAVEIEYDPAQISYYDLVKIFFDNHNPTLKNRQGPDVGSQYRSSIFYHSTEQKEVAAKVINELIHEKRFAQPIVTEIAPATTFWPAEEYHQKYLLKRGKTHC